MLKTRFILLLFFLLPCIHLSAQNESKTPTFGIRAGVLLSKISGDEMYEDFSKLVMPGVGAYGNYYFTKRLSLQADLNYMPKGAKFKGYDLKTNLHYVELSSFAKRTFLKDPEVYIYGGAYFSYLISANTKGTLEDLNLPEPLDIDEDVKSKVNSFDYGLAAGVGIQGRFNRTMDIFLDARYYFGIANLSNSSGEERYNLGALTRFEVPYSTPMNRNFYITTGFFVYLDPR